MNVVILVELSFKQNSKSTYGLSGNDHEVASLNCYNIMQILNLSY